MRRLLIPLLMLMLLVSCGMQSGTWDGPRDQVIATLQERVNELDATDLSGVQWNLEQMRGKVVLIDFWATWCGPCLVELPHLQQAYARYRQDGFVILGISLDEGDVDTFRDFLEQQGVPWPQIFDGRGFEAKVARDFGITAIPRSILIDREGKILSLNLRGRQVIAQVAKAVEQPS